MYVKKGWQGLFLFLLMVTIAISCNNQLQKQNKINTINNNSQQKQQTAKLETDKTTNEKTTPILIEPAYGTYFSKLSPKHAWLDTLTIEHILQQKWLNYDDQDSIGQQTIRLNGVYVSQQFRDMLPLIPMDSFNIYTAHWYGLDENYSFENKTRTYNITDYSKKYVHYQYYKNTPILNKILHVTFLKKHNGKPTSIMVRLARNLALPVMNNDFPYDSLYMLASDSLRMPNGDKYDGYYYKNFDSNYKTIPYNPQKYPVFPQFRKSYIFFNGSAYFNINEIYVHDINKQYRYRFDNITKKLMDVENKMNYCFDSCVPMKHKETLENLHIYYYNNTSTITSPAKYPNLNGVTASQQNLLVKFCDDNNNNLMEASENKTLNVYATDKKINVRNLFPPPAPVEQVCWVSQQNILENTFFFSSVNAHKYFDNNFGQNINNLDNLITQILVDHNTLNNAGSIVNPNSGPNGESESTINLGVGDAQDDPNDPTDDNDCNSPFATLDIVGHEFTHTILQAYKLNGDLNNTGEAYAIKEAFCDIFGFLIEREHTGANDYIIMNHARLDENRNMANPFASFPNKQPAYYQGRFWYDSNDGHHRNGVLNYWFYILTNGGTFYPDRCDKLTPGVFTVIPAGQCQPATITGIDPSIIGEVLFNTIISDQIEPGATFQDLCVEATAVISMMIEEGDNFGDPCSNEGLQAINDFLTAWELIGVPCNIDPNQLPCDMGCGFLQPSDIWQISSPVPSVTNASSLVSNDGSITINLSSIHNLAYHWSGPNGYSSITNTNSISNLTPGLYAVDVYVAGTYCLYNSYTARVRVNLNTPVCYIDDSIVSTRVAPKIFSDAATINIALDTEDGFNAQLKVYNMQGIPVANLIEGGDNLLQGGTHTFTFDGSSLPNGLYAINLKLIVPSCLRRVGYDETIRVFKHGGR